MIGRRTLLKGVAVAGAAAAAAAPRDAAASGTRATVQPDDVGMLFDTTLCIGCRGCVTKCKESNKLPVDRSADGLYDAPNTLNGTTKNVIQVTDLGEGKWQFVKAQCMHCADPACVSVCMAHALHKIDGGIVAYDASTCVGCRYCQVACPFDVPKFQWNQAFPLIVKCELCRHRADPKKEGPLAVANPACCETCPREAVIYGSMKELQATAAKRMADAPERYNPKVFGEKDGGGTHVLYMTAKGVAFEQLGLPALPEHGLPATAEKVQHTMYWGFIPPIALYAGLAWTIVKNKKKQSHAEEK